MVLSQLFWGDMIFSLKEIESISVTVYRMLFFLCRGFRDRFPHCPEVFFNQTARQSHIMTEIEAWDTDVVCLQVQIKENCFLSAQSFPIATLFLALLDRRKQTK